MDKVIRTVGSDTSMYEHYFEIYDKYYPKYKESLVILYRSGQFYEIMETMDGKGFTTEIHKLLLLMPYRRQNYYGCGFQATSLDTKFLQQLISAGKTVIIVEEIERRDDNKITRGIQRIVSAGTNINSETDNHNYILSIYMDLVSVGLSVFSATTNDIYIQETYNTMDDPKLVEDEIYRWINMYLPKEILIRDNTGVFKLITDMQVYRMEEISEYNNLSYQRQFFDKIFKKENQVDILDYMDVSRKPMVIKSLMYLLDYLYEHNENLLKGINLPREQNISETLILDYNTIMQLNLISDNNLDKRSKQYNSIYSVINEAKTSMGRRLIKDRLVNPITNGERMESRYNKIELFKNDNNETIINILSNIPDMEKMLRKMENNILSEREFANFGITLKRIILELVPIIPYETNNEGWETIVDDIFRTFRIEDMLRRDYNSNIFNDKIIVELDNIEENISVINKRVNIIMNMMNSVINNKTTKTYYNVKWESTDVDGWYISSTIIKGEILKKSEQFKGYVYRKMKTNYRITSEELDNLSNKLLRLERKRKITMDNKFRQYQQNLINNKRDYLVEIIKMVARVDVYSSQAKLSIKNVYNKPEVDKTGGRSYILSRDLRHLLIERIITGELYVPNDVEIGTDKVRGLLLYGVNASGKTSYVKSIGISLILAQAGFYVPAAEFKFRPFSILQTRITGNDNLFKSQSSFEVEMEEVRNILSRSNENTLVLGDEICRGTTPADALGVVGATINYLEQINKTNFIFATHLHDLSVDDTLSKTTISKHMKVIFEKNVIIYNRKLEDTAGEQYYGVEVAEALGLPKKLIKDAELRRKRYLNKSKGILATKKSRYSSKVFMDKCQICGKTQSLDTNHINEQRLADENNNIGHINKNNMANLSILCKECHKKEQKGKINVKGYRKTSKGIKLEYEIKS